MNALFALLIVGACAINFNGNVSFNDEVDFAVRHSSLQKFGTILAFHSASIDGSANQNSANAKANTIIAKINAGLLSSPSAVLGYFSSKIDVSLMNADVDGATGVVGISYPVLYEMNNKNEIVDTVKLNTFGMWEDIEDLDAERGLRTSSSSQVIKSTGKAILTVITSDVVGKLDVADVPVGPKSVEMLLEVKDYPLASEKNHLRLKVVTAIAGGEMVGNALVSQTTSEVYATLAATCVANGKTRDVEVSAYAESSSESTTFTAGISGSAKLSAYVNYVDFEPGLNSFVYDPAIGQGQVIYGASSALYPCIALLIALIAIFLF